MSKEKEENKYINLLKERGAEKRISRPYQITGLKMAELLDDKKHKALYIKLAKENNESFLLGMAKDIAEKENIKNKGAYFMTMLKKEKMDLKILTIENKKNEKFLRTPTNKINLKKEDKKELKNLIKSMRGGMIENNGAGLSANQIGLNKKLFVAQIPDQNGKSKFYSIINPEITKTYSETEIMNEGCLSIPGIIGPVERPYKIILEGKNVEGKNIKIKAWGFLARVFQHETDHLNGKLFTDKTKETFKIEDIEKNQSAII